MNRIRCEVREYPLALLDEDKQRAALEQALDIRKFEIELYWTRSSYFWAFIGAAMAGYGAVQSLSDNATKNSLSQIVCSLGLVFSFSWYFANRGSKQWHENWENHVELLEDGVIGPLHKTTVFNTEHDSIATYCKNVISGSGAYSVSKINQIVSCFTVVLWLILYWNHLYIDPMARLDWQALMVGMSSLVFIFMMWKFGRSSRGARSFRIESILDQPDRAQSSD